MQNITFISTMHQENGNCNADELFKILREEKPQVIFLEALENTYSNYDKFRYSSFDVYHNKLEIAAIQKYCNHILIVYVPVLDDGLPDSFNQKYKYVCEDGQLQGMIDEYNLLAKTKGFNREEYIFQDIFLTPQSNVY